MFSILPAAYVGQGRTGSNSVAGLSQWLTLLVFQLCSLPTVLPHWPELLRLMSSSESHSITSSSTICRQALAENPAIADWFLHERIHQFIKHFYVDILGATDYLVRYEWQYRGSPHVHGLAWLPNSPDTQQILHSTDTNTVAVDGLVSRIDQVVTTINPAILRDGSNGDQAPPPQTAPHICNKPYADVQDFQQDYEDLIATCQRHTRCSPAYCLRTRGGQQQCRFGYPKPLQPVTTLTMHDGEPEVVTTRNDGLIDSHFLLGGLTSICNTVSEYCVSLVPSP